MPRDAGEKDPFADLTRIIGFDPRVKILKQPEGARPAPVASPPAREAAPAEARTDEWEAEFADLDFGLKPAAEPVAARHDAPPAAPAPAVQTVPTQSVAPVWQAPASPDVGSFETAEEIDEITAAFEREWHAKAVWAPTVQAVAMQPMPAAAFDDTFEGEEEPQPAQADEFSGAGQGEAELFGSDLDDVLAASMELELEDDWLNEATASGITDGAVAEELPAAASAEAAEAPAASEQAAVAAPPAFEAATPKPAPPAMDFEQELAALLGSTTAPGRQPVRRAAAPVVLRSEPPPVRPAAPAVSQATAVPDRSADQPTRAEARVEPIEQAQAARPESQVPKQAPASREPAAEDDDPFAALAAMAARYRAGQTAPRQPSRIPQPAAPAAPPLPAAAQTAEPKQEPEADPMKRPSNRTDTPEIDTVALPEHLVATADLDIPANSYGVEQDRQSARGRFNEYDDEFDDLIQEMSSGERAIQPRQAAPAPRQAEPAYAPAPRQAQPRPAMPRAATIPENAGRRTAQQPAQPAYDQARSYDQAPSYDQDWDDYAAPAAQSAGYAEADDDYGYADERGAPTAKPARKKGRWFAALFGSVAVVAAGGAYALKFTGAADNSGPVLVKADASPLKIRPENPGGATVPNQENQVYDRVAGIGNTAAPQEKLLSSAEEPVTLDEPEEEASDEVLPGLELSGDDMSIEAQDQGEPKGEDRVDAAAAGPDPASDDAIAIAPRKVRTMVVKPDGTLAPRDEATPAVQALASNAADVLDTVKKGSQMAAAGVDMNESTASVTPSDDNAAGPAAANADDVAAVQPAVMGATGEWTVQIASQPSEAGARSTYADLAKKYSSVLSGRPASIVKADVAGKGTVWRVRVAAEDRSEAAALCTSYKAAGGSCFVTK